MLETSLATAPNSAAGWQDPFTRHPRLAFLLVALLYFTLHSLWRLLLSDNLSWDEAEQFILAERAQLGYNAQGPLYTWLQALAFALLGKHLGAVVVVNNAVLLALYYGLFATVYHVARRAAPAWLACFSALLIPPLAIEAHTDLTHTLLAVAGVVWMFYWVFQIIARPTALPYVGLGLSIAVALLSKYNTAAVAALLALVAASIAPLRPYLFTARMGLTLGVVLAAVLPTVVWLVWHFDEQLAPTLAKLQKAHNRTVWFGLGELQEVLVNSLGFWALFYAALLKFGTREARSTTPSATLGRSLCRRLALALLLFLLALIGWGTRDFRIAWLLPMTVLAPLYLGFRCADVELKPRWRSGLLVAAPLVVAAIGFKLFAEVYLNREPDRYDRFNFPYAELLSHWQARRMDLSDRVLVTDNFVDAGNLQMRVPAMRVAAVADTQLLPANRARAPLLLWHSPSPTPQPPAAIRDAYRRLYGRPWPPEMNLETLGAPYLHGPGDQLFWHYAFVEPGR